MVVGTAESAFDVESALLATICAQGDVVFEVADLVAPSDFAGAGLGRIYEVLRARVLDGLPNDTVSVEADLRARGKLEEAGGCASVEAILQTERATPSSASHYARLVSEASKRRQIAEIGQRLTDAARAGGDVDALAAMFDSAMAGLSPSRRRFVSPIGRAADEVGTRLRPMGNGEMTLDLLKTGFRDLGALCQGLRPGQLVIIRARPGMGKTAFALALALRAATRSGKRVLFLSLEMSLEELSERAIAELHHADASRADRVMTSMITPQMTPTMGARGRARRSISGLRLAPG